MKLLLPLIAGAAGLAAFAFSRDSDAQSSASGAPGAPGAPSGGGGGGVAAVVAEMTRALKSGDPDLLRATAEKLRTHGFPDSAADLERLANEIDAAVSSQPIDIPTGASAGWPQSTQPAPETFQPEPDPEPPSTPSFPSSSSSSSSSSSAPSAKALQAGQLAQHLRATRRGREDQSRVKAYQQANVDAGTPDGYYGPATALSLANVYDIVPPKPFYWPKNNTEAIRKSYIEYLRLRGDNDPARSSEWYAAAGV